MNQDQRKQTGTTGPRLEQVRTGEDIMIYQEIFQAEDLSVWPGILILRTGRGTACDMILEYDIATETVILLASTPAVSLVFGGIASTSLEQLAFSRLQVMKNDPKYAGTTLHRDFKIKYEEIGEICTIRRYNFCEILLPYIGNVSKVLNVDSLLTELCQRREKILSDLQVYNRIHNLQ